MTTPQEEANKALVLTAPSARCSTNQRDCAAAKHFWSADYIQHGAHIAPGRDACST